MADLSSLQRASGGFAMVAIDQREAMRAMFAEEHTGPVSDGQLTEFKVAATRILSPYASAVLVDNHFAFEAVITAGAVAPGCGLIVAADHFTPSVDEIVGDVEIDRTIDIGHVRAAGAVALKLLVLWRPDESPDKRIAMVEEFVYICREACLISIIEPVSRKPRDSRNWDWDAGIIAAARELGSLGADLYKAEVPTGGQGTEAELRRACGQLTRAIASPWVVLSSGVPADAFPAAVEYACREGASGFLAGRAIWRDVIGRRDLEQGLAEEGVRRLRQLAHVVDTHVHR